MNNDIYNEGFSSLGAKVAKAAKAGAADLSRPLKPLAIRAANLRPQLRDPRATVVPDTVAL